MNNLRATITAMLLLFAALCTHAQAQATKVAYHKDKPVQITAYTNVYQTNFASWWKKKLDKKAGFTDADAEAIIARLNAGGDKPAGMDKSNRDARVLSHYKAYEQYRFSRMGYQYSLVWLPYGENQHMPESLRPTNEEGCLFLLDGRDVTTEGKDFKGASLPLAGTPVSESGMQSGTATSGTTASGVQYSTADMSAFGPGLLGCMAIYPSNGSAFMYVVPVRGSALGDKVVVAEAAYKITGLADSRYRYEWFGGMNTQAIQQKYGRTMSVRVMDTYTIK